jgi:hypothetical protein
VSAECSKCGSDIVYPPGTWPVGNCPRCSEEKCVAVLEAERDAERQMRHDCVRDCERAKDEHTAAYEADLDGLRVALTQAENALKAIAKGDVDGGMCALTARAYLAAAGEETT